MPIPPSESDLQVSGLQGRTTSLSPRGHVNTLVTSNCYVFVIELCFKTTKRTQQALAADVLLYMTAP